LNIHDKASSKSLMTFSQSVLPCEQSPPVFLLGTARRSERDSAELVYILCGADNPKTWITMRNFRFDTGFITGFDPNWKLLIKSSSAWEIGSCLATLAHAQMNLYISSAESLSLLRAVPRRNTRGLCSHGKSVFKHNCIFLTYIYTFIFQFILRNW
jgi:hypothetical protein